MRSSSQRAALIVLLLGVFVASQAGVRGGLFDFLDKNKRQAAAAGKEAAKSKQETPPQRQSEQVSDSDLADLQEQVNERAKKRSRAPVSSRKRPDLDRIRAALSEQTRLAELNGYPLAGAESGELDEGESKAEAPQAPSPRHSPLPTKLPAAELVASKQPQTQSSPPADRPPKSAAAAAPISPFHLAFPNQSNLEALTAKRAQERHEQQQKQKSPEPELEEAEAEEDEEGSDDGYDSDLVEETEEVTIDNSGRKAKMTQAELLSHRFVSTKKDSPNGVDKRLFKPDLRARERQGIGGRQSNEKPKKKSKLLSGSFWGKKMTTVLEKTKTVILDDIPKIVQQSSDSISAMLQLDSKGRLLALIEEVNGDIKFVRREFSQFTLTWSPIMEKGLNYLGDHDLDKVKWNEKQELYFRRDALHSLAFGYEFARILISWRENLLVAHEAYKLYLETLKFELIDSKRDKTNSLDLDKTVVDENVIFQLKTIHTYMLLTAWQAINDEMFEAKYKLDHLMVIEDDQKKNYESEYFRNIVVLQEMYDPTIEEFESEQNQVTTSITEAGAISEDFVDVDRFFDNFREGLAKNEVRDVDWKVPEQLSDFLAKLAPQLEANPQVYSRSFLKKLNQAVKDRESETKSSS